MDYFVFDFLPGFFYDGLKMFLQNILRSCNQMKKNAICAMLLVLCMLLSLLAGCGKAQTEETASESAAPSDAVSAPAQEKATVSVAEETDSVAEAPLVAEEIPAPEPFELPITQEETTLTLWMRTEPFTIAYPEITMDNATFYKEMAKRTNVNVEITGVIAFQASEQFNLMVASGEYCDMIGRFATFYTAGLDAGIDNGVIVDMSEFMETYMPNYNYALQTNDSFRRDCTTAEGRIGAANSLYEISEGEQIGPVIRKDWLDELGLEMPVTYDDYYEVLKAFQNAGHEGALALRWDGINSGNYLLAGFEAAGFYDDTEVAVPFLNREGTVIFGAMEDGYREYLQLMADWYAEGLMYQDFFSLDTTTYPQNLANGTFGISVIDRGQFTSTQLALEAIDPNADLVGLRDARKNADDVLHIQYIDQTVSDGYSISTSCDNVEVAAKYLDYLYTEEGSILAGYGVEGEGLAYDVEGNPQFSDLVLHNETYPCTPAMVLYATYGCPGIFDGSRYFPAYDQRTADAIELWGEDEQDWLYPRNASLTVEESEEYAAILSEVRTYVQEMTLKFITGAESLEQWDNYCQQLIDMGIEDAIAIKQTALERYMTH